MNIKIKQMVVGPVRTNCYIVYVENSKNAVIIDPGDESDEIERNLVMLGLEPVAILLTHGHFDHIGAVKQIRARYGTKVYAHKEEKIVLTTDKNLGRMMGDTISLEADEYVIEGNIIHEGGIDFEVIYTPGHTVGSCCYLIRDSKILFSGDTMFHYSHGRTDFPTGSQSAIIRSIQDKLLKLSDDTAVYPGHESDTTIGNERTIYDFN